MGFRPIEREEKCIKLYDLPAESDLIAFEISEGKGSCKNSTAMIKKRLIISMLTTSLYFMKLFYNLVHGFEECQAKPKV